MRVHDPEDPIRLAEYTDLHTRITACLFRSSLNADDFEDRHLAHLILSGDRVYDEYNPLLLGFPDGNQRRNPPISRFDHHLDFARHAHYFEEGMLTEIVRYWRRYDLINVGWGMRMCEALIWTPEQLAEMAKEHATLLAGHRKKEG